MAKANKREDLRKQVADLENDLRIVRSQRDWYRKAYEAEARRVAKVEKRTEYVPYPYPVPVHPRPWYPKPWCPKPWEYPKPWKWWNDDDIWLRTTAQK